MSTNENNSEVAVDKVGEEKADAKSDLKGVKRAAEVSAHVKKIYLIISLAILLNAIIKITFALLYLFSSSV